MPDSTEDTRDHIQKVQARLHQIAIRLQQRGSIHDESKLAEPEKSILDAKATALAELRYGTPEYAAAMAAIDMQPFLEHHYAHNAHHPQHYPNGIAGMSLLDVMEMLCDWAAAGERTKDGSIAQSLAVNRTRFAIDDQLFSILENTVKELGW
jgi:hypothetical protein